MRAVDKMRMSVQSLLKRRLRTVLTILGVVIGIAAIVIMMALGEGMNRASMDMIEQYGGIRTVTVREGNNNAQTGTDGGKKGGDPLALKLSDETVEMIRGMEHVELASPVLEFQAVIKSGQYEASVWGGQGMELSALRDKNWKFKDGDFPKEGEPLKFIYGNQVLMDFRNSKTNQGYYDTGVMPDIDLMNSTLFTIFDTDAYYQSKNSSGAQLPEEIGEGEAPAAQPKKYIIPTAGVLQGGEEDYYEYSWSVYCDIEALKNQLKKVYKNKPIPGQPVKSNGSPYKKLYYNSIYVKVDEIDNVQPLQQMLSDMGYQADSDAEWISQMQEQSRAQQAMLGGIGAVALLVAAIGIANTMMMSIYERTKEIGVMKVLGCDLKDIRDLFLIEAAFIGFVGGVLGIGMSYGVCAIINAISKAQTAIIPLWLDPAALAFAVFVGMAAGFMPSKRAMALSPLAAIRNE